MTPQDYIFHTKPFDHQLSEFISNADKLGHAYFLEMGTGKSKLVIDEISYLYEKGEIDAALIVAPDGVHWNWITQQISQHMPPRVREHVMAHCYETKKAQTKIHQQKCEALLSHTGLSVLTISFDGIVTDPVMRTDSTTKRRTTVWMGGKAFIWELLKARKVFYVVDESRRIKNIHADRTKVVVKSGSYAKHRRALSGTPVPNGPFDIYPQIQFCDPTFWSRHGIASYTAFKCYFGEFVTETIYIAGGKERQIQKCVGYKNLNVLNEWLKEISSRITTEDAGLNLPPQLYNLHAFEMNAEQKRVYSDLKNDFFTWINDTDLVTAPLAITRLLRFQQITSGYLPVISADPSAEPTRMLGTTNPRLDLVEDLVDDIPHQGIIWARFTMTIDSVMQRLEKMGKTAVRYDGMVDPDQRRKNEEIFSRGDAQFFVSKQQSGGDGLNLQAAMTAIYVENTFDLSDRQQSEKRPHRIGQEFAVNYHDIAALGTIDTYIIQSLLKKIDVSNQITGDKIRQWLADPEKDVTVPA